MIREAMCYLFAAIGVIVVGDVMLDVLADAPVDPIPTLSWCVATITFACMAKKAPK
jgi:multisubunit Na+/H+ antiporter MnhG subunit